jgi:hypothetical protein
VNLQRDNIAGPQKQNNSSLEIKPKRLAKIQIVCSTSS